MKKILLSIAVALMGFTSAFAAKAYPGPVTVVQSDGTELTVYLHGDENFSWYSTADGTLLVPVGDNYYVAQVEADGSLKATPQLAHNAELRGTIEKQVIEKQDKERFFHATDNELQAFAKSLNTDISNARTYFPHTGNGTNSPKVLVLMVQFPDLKFKAKDPKAAFDYFLNSEKGEQAPAAFTDSYKGNNLGSVRQYFTDMSCGTFTPKFDIAGVVTVSKSYAYYGEEPTTSGNGHDIHCTEFIQEACKLAKSELGVNFSDYDSNHDGKADLVYIIYAGLGQNYGGNANTLWAKTWVSPSNSGLQVDGNTYINSYGINSELNPTPANGDKNASYISGVGVFCHEFSHCMGLPDLYPYSSSAYLNNQEPEFWDLLDAGEYYINGRKPTPYSPWELDIMGWESGIETLDDTPRQITMQPYYKERKAYKIEAPDGQYLLLQNIQNQDWWVGYMSHGLVIQRIDYKEETVGLDHRMNNNPGKPEVTILPADGVVINGYLSGDGKKYTVAEYRTSHLGDPFPGSQNITKLTEAKLNNNVVLNDLLYNIQENADGTISFDYLKDFTTGIDSPIVNNDTEKDARIYTLDGRYMGTDKSQLNKGIYIIGKKKVIIQ